MVIIDIIIDPDCIPCFHLYEIHREMFGFLHGRIEGKISLKAIKDSLLLLFREA